MLPNAWLKSQLMYFDAPNNASTTVLVILAIKFDMPIVKHHFMDGQWLKTKKDPQST